MFLEDEDWDDEHAGQPLSKTATNIQQATGVTNVKLKTVKKKSLLRTLKTLGSVPDWKSEDHQQDSDSETEGAPAHKKKRKKKRSKRRKPLESAGEQPDDADVGASLVEEQPEAKKKKKKLNKDAKLKNISENKTKDNKIAQSSKENKGEPENTERVSRQQWKNKIKNKKKSKNKYRQNKPEEAGKNKESSGGIGAKEEVRAESSSNNSSEKISPTPAKRKEKECKPQKRKNSEKDTDASCPTKTKTVKEEKQIQEVKKTTDGGAKKRATESSVDGSGQRVLEITDGQQQPPTKGLKPEQSRKQRLFKEKLQKILRGQEAEQRDSLAEAKDKPAAPEEESPPDRSASLRSRMEQRLESARFRYINELLYTSSSGEAKRMFRQDPQAFCVYHKGYTAQVQRWPDNPVDKIISFIQQKPPSLVVADFGCGDCKIARSVKNKVHSFDLAAVCELVTVCDMAKVPLGDASVDIAVFCLSLMGTNLADFLAEANRVLKMGGFLKIAEVTSRFENVRNFTTALANLGFKLVSKDTENTHFFSFDFVKNGNAPENIKKFGLELKPCVYKKR